LKLCYIDEAGGFEAEGSTPSATPLMVVAGLILDHRLIRTITTEHLRIKQIYFPGSLGTGTHLLDYILAEIKSTRLKRYLRSQRRDERRLVIGYLDRIVELLERSEARVIGRVWVKEPGLGLDPASSYNYAIQDLARHFTHLLFTQQEVGLILCDSRMHAKNRQVSHSVFTLKQRLIGDALPEIVESPVFGVSDNHAGLQIADIVAGALLLPMACRTYCAGCSASTHMDPRYDKLRERYARRLRALQYLYHDATGRSRGGIVVSDRRGGRPSRDLFASPAPRAALALTGAVRP
jgi:Protein of unknown function (DUF3800)